MTEEKILLSSLPRPQLRKIGKEVNGFLTVDKPKGMVSKDVSRHLEKRFPGLKIGHVGTLDPMASGVLTLLFGKATRLQDLFLNQTKKYHAILKLGTATDSQDAEGEVVEAQTVPDFTEKLLASVALELSGEIVQIPPIYSAVKYKGTPLYRYAREGNADDVPLEELARTIRVKDLKIKRLGSNSLEIDVTCSKGTYIRVLGAQIAEKLGTVGHLIELRRMASGRFSIASSVNLDELVDAESIHEAIQKMEELDFGECQFTISDEILVKKLKNGLKVPLNGALMKNSSSTGFSTSQTLVLKEKSGMIFGLGQIVEQPSGPAMHMKRGL